MGKPIDPKIFDYKLSTAFIRYGVILILSIVLSHISRNQVPLSSNYEFPLHSFVNILIFGIIICSGSWIITNLLRNVLIENRDFDLSTINNFIIINLLSTLIIYTILFTSFFYDEFNLINYLKFLLVSFGVVTIENFIFLLYSSLQKYQGIMFDKKRDSFLICVGNKSIKIYFESISHACIEDGIVSIYTSDKLKYSTQFNTLDELEAELPKEFFYRANRQFIIHRNAVKQVTKNKNRKIIVSINGQVPPQDISVSRYKSKELVEWVNMPT